VFATAAADDEDVHPFNDLEEAGKNAGNVGGNRLLGRGDCSAAPYALKYAEYSLIRKMIGVMNTQQSLSERRELTRKLVYELLEERRQLWALHERLIAMQPFREDRELKRLVRQYCQILIDYISLEHFGIYQRIAEGGERRRRVIELADEIYPRLIETTDAALDFNDKCEGLSDVELPGQLAGELAVLGDALTTRMELEDRLIESMTA
jgi:regulator of sigma D